MPVAGATRGSCGEFKPVAPYPPFASGTGGWNHPVVGNGGGIVDHIGDPDPKSISFIGKLLSAEVPHRGSPRAPNSGLGVPVSSVGKTWYG
jgi:hypothetical protein